MQVNDVLTQLFPERFDIQIDNSIVSGTGLLNAQPIAIIGTCDQLQIGASETLALGDLFLQVIKQHPGRPILMLVDNTGQRMALVEELLCLPQYIGQLLAIQDYARRNGHNVISLVYGSAIAGGFIAFGIGAQSRIYATADAKPSVMHLGAIARVTKLPVETLEELAKTVPVFAPGCANLYKVGGLHEIWADNLNAHLQQAFAEYDNNDNRAELALARGGRTHALRIIDEIINA